MKILIDEKNRKYLYKGKDMHTKDGVIKKEDIEIKNLIKSSKGKVYRVVEANFYDKFLKIKRGPQILTPKDIGYIISRTGIGRNSIIVEAGGGSGAFSCYLGNICKKVYTYEVRKENIDIIKQNLEFLDICNVKVINDDIKNLKEKNFDLLFLDLPDPDRVLESIINNLKKGIEIVCYLPSMFQVEKLVEFCNKNLEDFFIEEVTEILKRDWIVEHKKVRPQNQMLGHTAFLVFIKKI